MKRVTHDEIVTLVEDYLWELESDGKHIRMYSEIAADSEYPEYANEQIAEYSEKVMARAKRARELIDVLVSPDQDDEDNAYAKAAE